MADVTNNVRTVMTTQTAGAAAAVKHLRGVERDEAKKTLALLEQQNAKMTDQLAVFTKAAAGLAAVTIAWKALGAAASAHLEDLRLESAAAGADVDRLRDSTRGLVETDNLLAFAGRAMHGVWKLNQAEMETVAKGTDVLAKRLGLDLQTAMEGVTEAVTKGTTRSLKELGIEAKDKESALKAFAEAARDAGKGGTSTGEQWQQALVIMEDAWDDLKGAVGEAVVSMAPLIKAIAEMVSKVKDLVDLLPDVGDMGSFLPGGGGFLGSDVKEAVARMQAQKDAEDRAFYDKFLGDKLPSSYGDGNVPAGFLDLDSLHWHDEDISKGLIDLARTGMDTLESGITQANDRAKKFVADAKKHRDYDALEHGMAELEGTIAKVQWGAVAGPVGLGGAGAIDSFTPGKTVEGFRQLGGAEDQAELKRFREEMAGARQEWMEWQAQIQGPSILEQIFGRPDEITALSMAIDVARAAVDGLAKSIAASFEAAVTGSDSAIDAFKKVAAGAVHAIGQELAVIGAKELILAAVSAATFDFSGAARHTGVSALAFAGSAAAFSLASSMGYGKSTASLPRGAGAGAALGGGRGARSSEDEGRGDRNTVVMLGRDFGFLPDIEQRSLMYQAMRQGNQHGGGSNQLRFR